METKNNATFRSKSNIYQYVTCALMATIICILAPLSIPIGPIPISLTNLVLYFSIFILSTRGTCISYIVYLFIGMAGLPVFSGFAGGLAKLAGPTGGYLIGFIPMILIMGIFFVKTKNKSLRFNNIMTFIGMFIGTLAAYALGTAWFVYQMGCTWGYALTVCVFPFIPFDIAKMLIAIAIGRLIRNPLLRQGFIE